MKLNLKEYKKYTRGKIQKGDILKLVTMREWKKQGVTFIDEELQKKIANSFVKVVDIEHLDDCLYAYEVITLKGENIPDVKMFDSDIQYYLRKID